MSILCRSLRIAGFVVVSAMAAIDPVRAQEASCDYSQYVTADNSVVISANSGALLSTRTEFSSHKKRVDLYFVNKNPFGYTYKFDVKGTAIEEGIISAAFLKLGILPKPEAETKAPPPPAGGPVAPPPPLACGMAAATPLKDAVLAADSARIAAVAEIDKQSTAFDKSSAEYDALLVGITSALPETAQACAALKTNVKKASGFETRAAQSIQAVEGTGKTLAAAIADLKKETAAFEQRLAGGAPAGCPELARDAKKKVEEVEGTAKKVAALQKSMGEKLDTMKANNKMLSDELSRPDAFVTQYPIGPASEPMSYDIKITRTARKDDAVSTFPASAAIKLGSSRFSYSAGVAYAFGDKKTYARQASVVDDAVVNVVGVSEDSDSSVGVVGQLNGRFAETGAVSWMWSLGASLTESEEGAQFGFYTGPTMAAIGDKLFFTLAYHLREETELSSGFEVGDVVPEDLEGEIPTTKKTRGAWLLSVTYKIQ